MYITVLQNHTNTRTLSDLFIMLISSTASIASVRKLTGTVKLGTHYPCWSTVSTGREHGHMFSRPVLRWYVKHT